MFRQNDKSISEINPISSFETIPHFKSDSLDSLQYFLESFLKQTHRHILLSKALLELNKRIRLIHELISFSGSFTALKRKNLNTTFGPSLQEKIYAIQDQLSKLTMANANIKERETLLRDLEVLNNAEFTRQKNESEMTLKLLQIEKFERDNSNFRGQVIRQGLLPDISASDYRAQVENKAQSLQFAALKNDLNFLVHAHNFEVEFIVIVDEVSKNTLYLKLQPQVEKIKKLFENFYVALTNSYIKDNSKNSHVNFSALNNEYSDFKNQFIAIKTQFESTQKLGYKLFSKFKFPNSYNKFVDQNDQIDQVINLFKDYSKKGILYVHWRHHQKLANQIVAKLTSIKVSYPSNQIFLANEYLNKIKTSFLFENKIQSSSSFMKRLHFATSTLLIVPEDSKVSFKSKI